MPGTMDWSGKDRSRMRIAVMGRNGQVATALRELDGRDGVEVRAIGRPDCDLTRPESVLAALRAARPDVVVNAAAWTAVDKAEAEREAAFAVNAVGAEAVAAASAVAGAPVIQLSTDYVYDGRKSTPYVEGDAVGPRSAYGASKLEGERRVASAHPDHAILRVAWLHGPTGGNFVRTMLRLAETREEISVVADQIGNPTSAAAVARGVASVARNLLESSGDGGRRGVFHMTCSGEATWADFAEAVFAGAAERGLPAARVRRIPTAEYPTPAPRPANSRLDCSLLAACHGIVLPDWRQALDECLSVMAARTG
jgi:dTDP-4-dehydrorhamnose reductase